MRRAGLAGRDGLIWGGAALQEVEGSEGRCGAGIGSRGVFGSGKPEVLTDPSCVDTDHCFLRLRVAILPVSQLSSGCSWLPAGPKQ